MVLGYHLDEDLPRPRALAVLVVTLLIEWPGVSHGGTLLEETFVGPITQRTVHYNIYLPDGYENGNEHYPVVYHLHGLGGNQGGGHNTVVPQSFEAARQAGVIGPVIVVFPNGYVDSFWADSWDGAKPAETNVALEPVPHVEHLPGDCAPRRPRNRRLLDGCFRGGEVRRQVLASVARVCVLYDGAFLASSILVPVPPVDCPGDLSRRGELLRPSSLPGSRWRSTPPRCARESPSGKWRDRSSPGTAPSGTTS